MSDSAADRCCCRRSGGGLLRTALSLAVLYLGLVFGSGTLINTGQPVAVEVGRLVRLVTFVEPTIRWADHGGHRLLAVGLRTLAHGVDIG